MQHVQARGKLKYFFHNRRQRQQPAQERALATRPRSCPACRARSSRHVSTRCSWAARLAC